MSFIVTTFPENGNDIGISGVSSRVFSRRIHHIQHILRNRLQGIALPIERCQEKSLKFLFIYNIMN
jgi:hypothetical protein